MYTSERSGNIRYYSYGPCSESFSVKNKKTILKPTYTTTNRRSTRDKNKRRVPKQVKDTPIEKEHSVPVPVPPVLCKEIQKKSHEDIDYILTGSDVSNVGYKFMNVELDRDWTTCVQKHTRKCIKIELVVKDAKKESTR